MCYRLYISLVVVSFCRFIRGDNTELSKNVIVGSSYNTLHLKSCHSANHRGYIKMFQGYKLHLLLSFLSSSTLFGSSKGRFCTFCIVKYGRTFILVHLINRNKKKLENFQEWLKLDHFQPHFFGGWQLKVQFSQSFLDQF